MADTKVTHRMLTDEEAAKGLRRIFADLQVRFNDQWDHLKADFYVEALSSRNITLTEENAALKAQIDELRPYSYETVKGLVKWRDERIAELEAQNERLKAPLSDDERKTFERRFRGDGGSCLKAALGCAESLIAARASTPQPQELHETSTYPSCDAGEEK